jgi:mannose-6-phosphate isomerase-like protein (cupin superfamily)
MIICRAVLLLGFVVSLVTAEEEAVTFVSQAEMAAAFAKGQRLVTGSNYAVSASRRDKVGTSEFHDEVTDVFYFVEGEATFVTGGTLVEKRQTKPGEWRGTAIIGGDSRAVAAGDTLVVPKGTPHWFSAIDGVIEYYIVKVREPKATSE